ncbi:N-acetylglutamate kinase [Nannocystis exedens]|uniref:Acetylglutamate kinase n=1 Tax=Nannocystis exedens TaxID=54 RepID=A0A1I1W834_9BACT|nr:acetylglutamate kinase [Nannocystis exedens]PCC67520.1 acetylglutamate kinase [Nannocystis exedens]SFD91345.1 N-acetylglutamate kinase [Nannocystis exedens]
MTTAVLKFGGEVIADAPALAAVLADVARLTAAGWKFAICHGGGPQANALQERLGLQPVKVGGRRVTDEATLQVMKYVLAGELSVDVVAAALAAGVGGALGISGVSAGLVSARRRPPTRVSGGGEELVDFGLVGDVVEIRTALIEHLWAGGYTPVINTLGVGLETAGFACPVYNINADTVSSAIAGALKVDHLFLMTGVPGVLRDKDDPTTRIARLSAAEARGAIEMKVIVGGMIPKVEEALANLALGIGAVHILGASAGALQAEAATPGSVGTVLVA